MKYSSDSETAPTHTVATDKCSKDPFH